MVGVIMFAAALCGAIDTDVLPGLDAGTPAIAWVRSEIAKASEYVDAVGHVHLALGGVAEADSKLRVPAPAAPDAFTLHPVPEQKALYIVGTNPRGVVYGALWLAERLRIEGAAALQRSETRAPVFQYRNLNDAIGFRTPKGSPLDADLKLSLRFGCNVELGRVSPYACTDWREIDQRLAAYETKRGKEREVSRQAMRDFLAATRTWNLDTIAPTSPFYDMVDYDTLIATFGNEVSEDGFTLSAALEKPWDLWQGMLRQYFRAFPEAAGIRVTMQDAPERVEMCLAKGPRVEALGPAGIQRRFVEKARATVVDELGKRLVITSWGNPPDTYPLNVPKDLKFIFDGIPGNGVVLQNNNCEHDFYLISPFNDNFGMALVPQGIMVQVQRQEQGRGYVPVYTGPQLRKEFSRCARLGDTATAEARLWASENLYEPLCWTWWNLYAWQRACWEPDGDPWEWARDWNVLQFGHGGAEELADALMMTEEIARRTFYITEVSGSKRDAYAIVRRTYWTDGRHYSEKARDALADMYRDNHLRGSVNALLEQAEATRTLSRTALDKARAAARAFEDAQAGQRVVDSFVHLDALVTIGTHYQQAILLFNYANEPDLSADAAQKARHACARHARTALDAFNAYWSTYSLYKDGGMVATLRGYLRKLGERLPEEPEPSKCLYLPWSDLSFQNDGRLDEAWPEPCLRLANTEPGNTSSSIVRMARATDGLHVAVEVKDDALVPVRGGRIVRSDSVELSFDTDRDGKTDTTVYFALDENTRQPVMLWALKNSVLISRNHEDRAKMPPNKPGAAVALTKTSDGYVWEGTIPWTMLQDFEPKGKVPLGVYIMINDVDTPGGSNYLVAFPDIPVWRQPPPPPFAYGVNTLAEAQRANLRKGPARAGFKVRMLLPD